MNLKTLLLSLLLLVAVVTQAVEPVKITGSMSGLKDGCQIRIGTALEALSRDYTDVKMDENGHFEVSLYLEEARIISLGYVLFFAIPGANIEIEEIKGREGSRSTFNFKGDYAELNNFVDKNKMLPKSGSYCMAGLAFISDPNRLDLDDYFVSRFCFMLTFNSATVNGRPCILLYCL